MIDGRPSRKRRLFSWFLGLMSAAALVLVTGIAQRATDLLVDGPSSLVTGSAVWEFAECGTSLYVQDRANIDAILDNTTPIGKIHSRLGGIPAGNATIQVSIQGETDRKVTLTSLRIRIERSEIRPGGAIFTAPCGDDVYGRSVLFDLDADPPRVVKSNNDADASLLMFAPDAEKSAKPLKFPWEVDVRDPVLIYVVARTKECFCRYRVEIPWQSGSKVGTIVLDNDGEGFPLAPRVAEHYVGPYDAGWKRNEPGPAN